MIGTETVLLSFETGPQKHSRRSSAVTELCSRASRACMNDRPAYRRASGVDRLKAAPAMRRRGRRSRANKGVVVDATLGESEQRLYESRLERARRNGKQRACVVVECRTAERHTKHSRPCRFFPPSFFFLLRTPSGMPLSFSFASCLPALSGLQSLPLAGVSPAACPGAAHDDHDEEAIGLRVRLAGRKYRAPEDKYFFRPRV